MQTVRYSSGHSFLDLILVRLPVTLIRKMVISELVIPRIEIALSPLHNVYYFLVIYAIHLIR